MRKAYAHRLSLLDAENIEYYLMDDLNCDLSSIVLDHGSRLMDIAELYNLSQLINEPTRTTDSSSTLVDHIFTNTPNKLFVLMMLLYIHTGQA